MDTIVEVYVAIIVALFFISVYLLLKRCYQYWDRRGVPYLEPHLIFGNVKDVVLYKESFLDNNHKLYQRLSGHKFGGYFKFQRPMLMIRDPELIKHVMAKDFSYFCDRNKNFINEKQLLSYHLFNLTGEKWKTLRVKLTPTFTSGKMKLMFHLMKECADVLDDFVSKSIQTNDCVEMKEIMARYTTDIISSCAFGLQADSMRNPESEFRKMGEKIFEINFKRKIFTAASSFSPIISKRLSKLLFDDQLETFFLNLVKDTVKYREENNIARTDFLQLLMALRTEDREQKSKSNGTVTPNGHNKEEKSSIMEMTPELMAAQCFIFFIAGFETSSSVLSFCFLELARHPDIQERVREEIKDVLNDSNGEITYTSLQKMPYLDKVVSETMRLYPSLSVLFRQCTKEYRIPDTDVIIEEGTEVFIPVYSIQRDPQYYDNPDEFNPENFSEENKKSRHPYTYLPFGEGPRICIGLRFGLMQVKLGIAALITKYKFELSSHMKLPVKFRFNSITTSSADGIWLICSKC